MELTNTVTARCHAQAFLNEAGDVRLRVFAEADYKPGATTTVEVGIDELPSAVQQNVRSALEAAITAAQPLLGRRIGAAIHKSREVAAAFQEL